MEIVSIQETMTEIIKPTLPKPQSYEDMRSSFENFWPNLVDEIRKHLNQADKIAPLSRLFHVLQENVPGGKKSRGLILVNLFRHLKPVRTPREDQEAYVLGWCIELLQAACLIADDMIDDSETRRGKPCWFRNADVGRHAINDVLFLENIVYGLIDRWFLSSAMYPQLLKLMNETKMWMIIGEDWDSQMGKGIMNFDKFTEEAYKGIVDMKTGYYTFYAPVGLALALAGYKDQAIDHQVKELMLRYGQLFQIQDDMLDCFGDPQVTGKVGTDILDVKCTWLAVKTLQIASADQKALFKELYGVAGREEDIKKIYRDLKIPEIYADLEKSEYRAITEMIEALPASLPQKPFLQLLSTIMGRRK